MYPHPTCMRSIPPCKLFDPEGILPNMASSISVFIGLYFGYTFSRYKTHWKRVSYWMISGILLVSTSVGVHFSGIPYNPNLYSLSYILLMAGTACILLSLFYVVIDVPKFTWHQYLFMPLIVMGMNSIVVYSLDDVISMVTGQWFFWKDKNNNLAQWIYDTFFTVFPEKTAILISAMCRTIIHITIAAIMYKKKIFVKI
jgi:predicted acyltransferase